MNGSSLAVFLLGKHGDMFIKTYDTIGQPLEADEKRAINPENQKKERTRKLKASRR